LLANGGMMTSVSIRARSKVSFRPDIQGLRTIAVAVVILDHLLGWPSGGFVGVDIFFVISGFLITGLLLREHDRTGSISFTDFYRRRIKRILPAATLVLVVTTIAAWLIFPTGRFVSTLWDAVCSFLFAGNWRFASAGVDYFQADGPVSPLQHYWSLATEEQFYFVWPWLMLLIFAIGARSSRWGVSAARRNVGIAMLIITAASFVWALWDSIHNPTWAYFSTFSRTWELGVGALIAVFSAAPQRLPSWLRPILGWVGIAGIGASLFLVSDEVTFPAPWAALPVLSTALVIFAGTGGEQRFMWPLTNPTAIYIGNVSFSLYLWHFPVIILLGALLPPEGTEFYVGAAILIALLSIASYHLVEDPIRKSRWLEKLTRAQRDEIRRGKRRERSSTQGSTSKHALAGLTALAVITSILVVMALSPRTPETSSSPVRSEESPPVSEISSHDPVNSTAVSDALAVTAWPELTPSIDALGPDSKAPEWVEDGCLGEERNSLSDPIANAKRCSYGDSNSDKIAVLYGDSVAISYLPGIRAALEPDGYRIDVFTLQQCPAIQVEVLLGDKSTHDACDPFRNWAVEEIRSLHPAIVFMSSAHTSSLRLASGASGADAASEWGAGQSETLATLAGSSDRLVVLDSPPTNKSLTECATRFNSPKDCASKPDAWYLTLKSASRAAASKLADPSIDYPDISSWFCNDGLCPSFVGTSPVLADGSHLTGAFSKSLAPQISALLQQPPVGAGG